MKIPLTFAVSQLSTCILVWNCSSLFGKRLKREDREKLPDWALFWEGPELPDAKYKTPSPPFTHFSKGRDA